MLPLKGVLKYKWDRSVGLPTIDELYNSLKSRENPENRFPRSKDEKLNLLRSRVNVDKNIEFTEPLGYERIHRIGSIKKYVTGLENKKHLRKLYLGLRSLSSVPWKVNTDVLKLQTNDFIRKYRPWMLRAISAIKEGHINRGMDITFGLFRDGVPRHKNQHTKKALMDKLGELQEEPKKKNSLIIQQDLIRQATVYQEENDFMADFLRIKSARETCDLNSYTLRSIPRYHNYEYDFRGRAYISNTDINYMGEDSHRGLLMFYEAKPLGESGFNWLKIHCANCMGLDKISFSDRIKFVEDNIDKIIECADGKSNWYRKKGTEPYQTFAACVEIAKAVRYYKGPENYPSALPVQMDGSCNGLQHYSALGKDNLGAYYVNMTPSDRDTPPNDAYQIILGIVEKQINKLAEEGVEWATQAKGKLHRKIIKQPVMTLVYGVTQYGAKLQIYKQLKDDAAFFDYDKTTLIKLSSEISNLIIASSSEIYKAATRYQRWMSNTVEMGYRVSKKSPIDSIDRLTWLTPLGFRVKQAYRKIKKQATAFPPNYIHSLDSSHMYLTAIECSKNKIAFQSVHDCFLTHACDVDKMNFILRDQFYYLHNQDLINSLHSQLEGFFGCDLPPPPVDPKQEPYDLNQIYDATYFFS